MPRTRPQRFFGREPDPVVVNTQHQRSLLLTERHLHSFGLGMLADVRKSFLSYAVGDDRRFAFRLRDEAVRQRGLELGLLGELSEVLVECGGQSVAVERRRAQLEHEVAQSPDREANRLLELFDRRLLRHPVQLTADRFEAQAHGGHLLDGIVVDVGSQTRAFLLLDLGKTEQQHTSLLGQPAESFHARS